MRQAESDLTLECQNGRVMRVPGGRMLAIMPLELHLEERYFPGSPWEFNPDREHWGWGGNR